MTRLSSILFVLLCLLFGTSTISSLLSSQLPRIWRTVSAGDLLRSLSREPGGSCHSSKTDERHAHRVEEHDEIRICHMLEQIQARGTGLVRYGHHERYDE